MELVGGHTGMKRYQSYWKASQTLYHCLLAVAFFLWTVHTPLTLLASKQILAFFYASSGKYAKEKRGITIHFSEEESLKKE